MRLWHYKLIPYLPKQMLVSQWRELIAIKRQWEKGTLKHRLVSYVMDYDKIYFMSYVFDLGVEMDKRNIKYKLKYYDEIYEFCNWNGVLNGDYIYPEHNDRYLEQCYYNLQEKADRGIISQKEWNLIEDNIKINDWTVDLMEQVVSKSQNGDFAFKLPDINKIKIKTKEE